MIQYLIWDAGGTLFDTYPAVVAACCTALHDFGRDAPSDWVLALCRESIAHGLRTLAAAFQLDEVHFEARFREAYAVISPAVQAPFPGVKRICRTICETGGQNFIVTHRSRVSLEALLAAHGMTRYFTDCIAREDPYPRKPDPASITALIARYNLDRSRCLAIGDRDLDILAGRRAGIRTCFFGPEAHATRADLAITDFEVLYRRLLIENAGYARG